MAASRITAEFIKTLNSLAIGGQSALIKPNELGSAIARPDFLKYYRPDDSGPPRLAAELAFGIIMNHPFADGNKRTAFMAANELLRENGHKAFVDASPDEIAATSDLGMQTIGDAHAKVATKEMGVDGLAAVYAEVLDGDSGAES